MSAIQLASIAALAGQEDWRRCTVGNNSTRYGYSSSLVFGAISATNLAFRGRTITNLYYNASGSGALTFIVNGIVAQNFFDCLMLKLANGQTRYFRSNDPNVIFGSGGGLSEWDWNPSGGASYGWSAAELGLTVGFALS